MTFKTVTTKATPPADDATVVVTFKGRKNCADTSVPITHGERDRRKVTGIVGIRVGVRVCKGGEP